MLRCKESMVKKVKTCMENYHMCKKLTKGISYLRSQKLIVRVKIWQNQLHRCVQNGGVNLKTECLPKKGGKKNTHDLKYGQPSYFSSI